MDTDTHTMILERSLKLLEITDAQKKNIASLTEVVNKLTDCVALLQSQVTDLRRKASK